MEDNRIDLKSVNKKQKNPLVIRLQNFLSFRKKVGPLRDAQGKFIAGSGGLLTAKKIKKLYIVLLILVAAASGGYWVHNSFAKSLPSCPVGTLSLGAEVAYKAGKPSYIRLCRIPGFKSRDPDDRGYVRVSATVANRWLKLYKAAKARGYNLVADGSFRSMKKQQYFYNCYRTKKCNNGRQAAAPGHSNHQSGEAVDIDIVPGPNNDPSLTACKKNPSKYPVYTVLAIYGSMKDIKLYAKIPGECWHWSPTGK